MARKHDITSQNVTIENHLKRFGSITTLEAVNDYSILRLSARIWDLRHKGLMIASYRHETPNGARVAKYVYLGEVINRRNT